MKCPECGEIFWRCPDCDAIVSNTKTNMHHEVCPPKTLIRKWKKPDDSWKEEAIRRDREKMEQGDTNAPNEPQ